MRPGRLIGPPTRSTREAAFLVGYPPHQWQQSDRLHGGELADYPAVLTTADVAEPLPIPVKKTVRMPSEGRSPPTNLPAARDGDFNWNEVMVWEHFGRRR